MSVPSLYRGPTPIRTEKNLAQVQNLILMYIFLSQLYVERCLLTEDQGDLEKYLHTWIHVSTQFSGRFYILRRPKHRFLDEIFA